MLDNSQLLLQRLNQQECPHIICYPKYTEAEFKRRLGELKKLKITTIEFEGEKHVRNVPVLGKGHVGIVTIAYLEQKKVALKIRRIDASRVSMKHEAQMLKAANRVDVGPHLLGVTDNFLVMEYVEGILLPEWLEALQGKNAGKRLSHVLRLALEQAWKMDKIGLDHGELSNASKHIIVQPSGLPCLVDFETASVSRNVSNVTCLCQYFFVGSSIAKLIQAILGAHQEKDSINALRTYKENKNRKSFENVLFEYGVSAKTFLE
ncbi:MAG: serine/threonine protein kinase [Candidatus Bathyarchaeota archaeon]|nr:MAG: serine/threonine protein kinase [Candidatus Bathyarchaeota archaeon]